MTRPHPHLHRVDVTRPVHLLRPAAGSYEPWRPRLAALPSRAMRGTNDWRPSFLDLFIPRVAKALLALALAVWAVVMGVVISDDDPAPVAAPPVRILPEDIAAAFPPGPPPPWVMPADWRPVAPQP